MLKSLACAGAVAIATLACGSAGAQTEGPFEREVAEARSERFEGLPPAAGFARSETPAGSWSVVSIYVQGPQSSRGRWVARRVASDIGAPHWTDAATCPDLVTSVALLEHLTPQRLEVMGMSPPARPCRYMADGAIQTVWSSGGAQPDGAPHHRGVVGQFG